MKRGFNQMGDGMGMCQSDAAPGKRPCAAMFSFPFPAQLSVPHAHFQQDACMHNEEEDDSDYSEHYRAYKEWWLSNAQAVSCGAITPQ